MFGSQKQLTWAKLRVGAVVTAGLAVIFLVIVFAGSIQRLFIPQASVQAEFKDVKGLRPGAPVWFAGVQIGSVRSMRFEGVEKITVSLAIDRSSLPYLKKDSVAAILTLGLLGDKYIELSPGSRPAAVLQAGDTIAGASRPEIADALEQFMFGIEGGKGSLGRLMSEDSLYRDLASSANDIRAFARMLKTSEGTVSRAVKDPAVYERFLSASKSLDAFVGKLEASQGTVRRLVEDPSLYENLNSAAGRLDKILMKIEKGEGAAGTLVTDQKMAEELRSTLKNLDDLVKDIKENPKKYFSFSIF